MVILTMFTRLNTLWYWHLWALKQVYLMNWQIVFYMEPLLYTSPNISKMLVCESLFLIVIVRALSLSLPAGWRVESFSPAFRLYTRSFWTSWRKLQPQWKGKAALLNPHTHTCRGFLHILGPIMGSLWLAFQLYKTAFCLLKLIKQWCFSLAGFLVEEARIAQLFISPEARFFSKSSALFPLHWILMWAFF